MVHHAAQAQRALALAAAALAVAVAAAGCGGGGGGGGHAAAPAEKPVIEHDLGDDMRLVDCTDWKRGDDVGRRGTIAELRSFAGGPVDNGHGSTLPEREAYQLFQNWCSRPYAAHFKLYKLYTRASAFLPGS